MNDIRITLIIILGIINLIYFVGCYLRLDPEDTPIKMWKEVWETRNIFGKICTVIALIVTLPSTIVFYLIALLYSVYYFIQYIGIKKHND